MKKPVPFEFIFDELTDLDIRTNPMFGCLAVYVGDKIMLILRDKNPPEYDNGIWLATTPEHHASLRADFPALRHIRIFGPGPTGWQNLPVTSDDFERDARNVCRLIRKGDSRIGKIPANKKKKPKEKAGASTASRKKPISDSPLRDSRKNNRRPPPHKRLKGR